VRQSVHHDDAEQSLARLPQFLTTQLYAGDVVTRACINFDTISDFDK
jgi:hypothetical protein